MLFYNKKILWIWNGNKKIRLFTIGLYLFDILLSILMLRKNYNGENKIIINFSIVPNNLINVN